jgi:ubiquinone/menaquinone biosynthesis C-methylase UbiE
VTSHVKLASHGFSNVDGTGQADEHAAYLQRQAGIVAQDREQWLAMLELSDGDAVLDAGTGLGEVALRAAELVAPLGRAVGVDLSESLVEQASTRAAGTPNVDYRVADLRSLPFDDNTFAAAYSERVFIHLDDAQAAMNELFRVLRPGGRLVIVDPDHTRAATDADDCDLADLLASRMALLAPNVRSGRHLRSQAVRAGFRDVSAEPFARTVTDRSVARGMAVQQVEDRVAALIEEGIIAAERGQTYLADQDRREAEGRFQVTTLWFLLRAVKP